MKKIKRNKLRKITGYILIMVGIMLPLVYFTVVSVKQIYSEFYRSKYSEQQNFDVDLPEEIEAFSEYNKNIVNNSDIIDPFVVDDYNVSYNIDEYKDEDKAFSYISIPEISVYKPVFLGASKKHLAEGAAHIDGTALPTGEINTRSVIAGHRGWRSDLMFLNLNKLENGDRVFIERKGQTLEYKVVSKEIILPSEWQRLKPVENKEMLTLLTCHPIRASNPKRLLVNCERVYENSEAFLSVSSDKQLIYKNIRKNHSSIATIYIVYLITLFMWIAEIIAFIKLLKIIFYRGSCVQKNQ